MRYVGIQHRVKKTTKGEARPTIVTILGKESVANYELATEQDELDFVHGRFPTAFRAVGADEDLKSFPSHHVEWRKVREADVLENFPEDHRRINPETDEQEIAAKVPKSYDGLAKGDVVAMILGGSGNYFAYALARKGMAIGATVLRIPPFILKDERGEESKEDDSELLARLAKERPSLFYPVTDRDLSLIHVAIKMMERGDVMKSRIACGQRLLQRNIGTIFCSPEGLYPEGTLEKISTERMASDATYTALRAEEKTINKELLAAVGGLDVYREIFEPIEGCGPAIAAPIIASIIDIRRFKTDAKLKAYAGVHVLPDGRFPRKRAGEVANWRNDLRQALYNFGDQCVRRKNSTWGLYYRQMKKNLRERHPEKVIDPVTGKSRYSDGHIHKMAIWRTLTRFVEWIHKSWWDLEKRTRKVSEETPHNVVPFPRQAA